jgi:APA family basic amino acid/polyamine antiporter
VVFADWIFFGLIVCTVFAYRRRDRGSAATTYRTPGYALLPALFVVSSVFVVVSVVLSNPRNAMLGVVLMSIGVPAFLLWRRAPRQN